MKDETKLRSFLAGFYDPASVPIESDNDVADLIYAIPEHRSASYLVDLENTTVSYPSIDSLALGNSGVAFSSSGVIVGNSVNMSQSSVYCNLSVMATPFTSSGQLRIAVQCADQDVSGNYTDPTSGLAQLPASFSSGGVLILNSGGLGSGTFNNGTSGQNFASGFYLFAAFQRPTTFARALLLSGGFYNGTLAVGFVAQSFTTGSGGGSTNSPSSGSPSV